MERFTAVRWPTGDLGPHMDAFSHVRGRVDHVVTPSHPPRVEHVQVESPTAGDINPLPGKERYFTTTETGERRLNLAHADIFRAKEYSGKALDGMLRARSDVRNKDNAEMQRIGQMDIHDMVKHVKDNRTMHFKGNTRELLLPYDYATPTAKDGQWGQSLFYHDGPLTIEGILQSDIPDKVDYSKKMVQNYVYMYHLLGHIPNGSTLSIATRSQVPALSAMGWRVFDAMQKEAGDDAKAQKKNVAWLGEVIDTAKDEFTNYWGNDNHKVDGSLLRRPSDTDVGYHDNAAGEMGEDMNWQAYGRDNDFQFVCMNGRLVEYTRDIAKFEMRYRSKKEARKWMSLGKKMKAEMDEKMFDGEFYRAVDHTEDNEKSEVYALGGYMPMYTGLAGRDKAEKLVSQLPRFETPNGLSNVDLATVPEPIAEESIKHLPKGVQRTILKHVFRPRQWGDKENPNDWPIRTEQVVKGLIRYGYVDDAIRVSENWLSAYTKFHKENGTFPEKLNTETGDNGEGVEYAQQTGFGWTIGAYLYLLNELPSLYATREAKKTPIFQVSSSQSHK